MNVYVDKTRQQRRTCKIDLLIGAAVSDRSDLPIRNQNRSRNFTIRQNHICIFE